jgi:MOSC domain-containing protein YiiM
MTVEQAHSAELQQTLGKLPAIGWLQAQAATGREDDGAHARILHGGSVAARAKVQVQQTRQSQKKFARALRQRPGQRGVGRQARERR